MSNQKVKIVDATPENLKEAAKHGYTVINRTGTRLTDFRINHDDDVEKYPYRATDSDYKDVTFTSCGSFMHDAYSEWQSDIVSVEMPIESVVEENPEPEFIVGEYYRLTETWNPHVSSEPVHLEGDIYKLVKIDNNKLGYTFNRVIDNWTFYRDSNLVVMMEPVGDFEIEMGGEYLTDQGYKAIVTGIAKCNGSFNAKVDKTIYKDGSVRENQKWAFRKDKIARYMSTESEKLKLVAPYPQHLKQNNNSGELETESIETVRNGTTKELKVGDRLLAGSYWDSHDLIRSSKVCEYDVLEITEISKNGQIYEWKNLRNGLKGTEILKNIYSGSNIYAPIYSDVDHVTINEWNEAPIGTRFKMHEVWKDPVVISKTHDTAPYNQVINRHSSSDALVIRYEIVDAHKYKSDRGYQFTGDMAMTNRKEGLSLNHYIEKLDEPENPKHVSFDIETNEQEGTESMTNPKMSVQTAAIISDPKIVMMSGEPINEKVGVGLHGFAVMKNQLPRFGKIKSEDTMVVNGITCNNLEVIPDDQIVSKGVTDPEKLKWGHSFVRSKALKKVEKNGQVRLKKSINRLTGQSGNTTNDLLVEAGYKPRPRLASMGSGASSIGIALIVGALIYMFMPEIEIFLQDVKPWFLSIIDSIQNALSDFNAVEESQEMLNEKLQE